MVDAFAAFQPSSGPLDSRFEQRRYLGPMDESNAILVGTASGVVKARTNNCHHTTHGSELAPNALEDDDGRVGIRTFCVASTRGTPFFSDKCDKHHRAEPLGKLLGCANARGGRKQAVDISEQCRSQVEAILATTTEGHIRLERAK